MLRLALILAVLPVTAWAEFRPHDLLAVAQCVAEGVDHAGRLSALQAGGWTDLPMGARAPASDAIGAAFSMRSLRKVPKGEVAEAVAGGQADWARRADEKAAGDVTWIMAGESATASYLLLTTDDGLTTCFLAVPADLSAPEFLAGANLSDKVSEEADLPGAHMILFDNAPSRNGVTSVMLPDPAFFAAEGVPVPHALILTWVNPPD